MILRWIINAAILFFIAFLYPDVIISNYYIALIVVLVLGMINVFIKPLVVLLTLPINILTLGLFTFIINGFLFWFVSTFIKGFDVTNFWAAVIGALLYSIISWFITELLDK